MRRRPRAPLPRVAAAVMVVALAGCRHHQATAPPPRPAARAAELPTVEVAPPPDAKVDLTRDVRERRRDESFSGVLPAGFPKGLPLPPHASLVDQGGGARNAWVELLVPQRLAPVREPYLRQLRGGGWELTGDGAGGWSARRGAAAVHLRLRAQGPSTRLRLEY